jgi:hypothetical protein
LNTRVLSCRSKRRLARTRRRERSHSDKASATKRSSVIKDSASKVISLWLDSTRSNICSM